MHVICDRGLAMTDTIDPTDGLALAEAIANGATTAMAVIEAAITRACDQSNYGAISHMAGDLGLTRAAAIDAARGTRSAPSAPFLGVPFLMKDLGAAAEGLPVTCGSAVIAPVAAAADSELARRFKVAGLVPFGVSTVPEFGLALSSEPAIGPIARNPWNPALTPGGSSGGAAAAVAAGIVALAHATDAGGSTRVPAACCGLVGLKPSRGTMPAGPDFNNYIGGIASELVVSRSLRDTVAALDACAGHSEGPFSDVALGGPLLQLLDVAPAPLRVGLCVDAGADLPISAANKDAVRHAGDVLHACGHTVTPIDSNRLIPLVADASLVFDRIISVNLGRNLSTDVLTRVECLTAATARRGRTMSGSDLQAAEMAGVKLAHTTWLLFREIDILITPMISGPPLPLGSFPLDHDDVDLHWNRMTQFAPFAAMANVAGTPALSIPHGTADDLPLSVQLIGPIGTDGLILRLARQLQRAQPWSFAQDIAGFPVG